MADQSATQGPAELTELSARLDMLLLCLKVEIFHDLIQLCGCALDNEGMSTTRIVPSGRSTAWYLGWVTAATLVVNVLSYALHLVATNALGPNGYGQFASLLAVQVVATVPALALQTVVARELVRGAEPGALRQLIRRLVAGVAAVSIVVAALLCLWFRQWPWWVTAAAFVAVPVLAGMSGELGIIQGRSSFGPLGWALLGAGIGKFVPATVVMVLLTDGGTGSAGAGAAGAVGTAGAEFTTSPVSSLSSVAAWTFVAIAVGCALAWAGVRAWNAREERKERGKQKAHLASEQATSERSVPVQAVSVRSVLWASQLQFLIMVFTQLDLVLVPRLLAPEEAGFYAAGAIFTKIALWLPGAVVLVFYPQMAEAQRGSHAVRRAVLLLIGIGAVVVAGTALVAPWVPALIGEQFRPVVPWLWLFALLGAIFSVLQALVVGEIAEASRQTRFRAALVWPLVLVEAVLLLVWGTTPLAVLLIAVGCASAAVVLVVAARFYSAKGAAVTSSERLGSS